jgi:hypothetical protein
MKQLMASPFDRHDNSDSSEDEFQMDIFGGFNHGLGNFPQQSIQMHSNFGGRGGTFKSTQMSYQTYIDENGNKQVKKMEKSNNRHIDERGNIMEDHEELYKDSGKGLNQMKKGRRLNDRGMQITKENRKGEYQEFRQFHNMDEDDMGDFISDWRNQGQHIRNKNFSIQQERQPLAIAYQQPEVRHAPNKRKRVSKKVKSKKSNDDGVRRRYVKKQQKIRRN